MKINLITIFLLIATKNGCTGSINVTCDYRQPKTCIIKDLTLKINDQIHITNAQSTVDKFSIYDSEVLCFPCGIDDFFSNIRVARIQNSTLRQFSFQDFIGFSSLKSLILKGNKIGNSDKKFKFSENSINVDLENNSFYFENSKPPEQNSSFSYNIVIFILVCILIGTNAAFIIKLRKMPKIKLITNSETELTIMHYEEINKNPILNPFTEIKHENVYNEDTNYEELVNVKPKNDEEFYAEIPIHKEQNEKEIMEDRDDSVYSRI